MQLLSVLAQASVANFDMTKLPFDDPEWVLDLGRYLGFDLLKLLLQGGDAQQHLNGKRWSAFAPFWSVWCNQCHHIPPGHNLLHLFKEFAFACLLGGEVQAEISLLHGPKC